jgi:hypothetical protein
MAQEQETVAQRIIREAVEKQGNNNSKPITVKTPSTQTLSASSDSGK